MTDYGDALAIELAKAYEPLVTAALSGDRLAFMSLLAYAGQKGYTTGFGAAVTS